MVQTRKTNQVDIDLTTIKDESTRIAFAKILELVNSFVGTGLDTEGTLSARNGIKSGFANDASLIMWTIKKDTILPDTGSEDHYQTVKVPGRILGVCGWAQFNGTTAWRMMDRDNAATTIHVSIGSGAPQNFENTVVFQNSDTANKNSYRAMIFYEPTVIDRQSGVVTT